MPLQELYDWLSKLIPAAQWEYYAILFGALVAIATFYREVLKGILISIIDWISNIKNIFSQAQLIPKIEERLNNIEKNQEINRVVFNNTLEELKKRSLFIESELSINSGKSLKDIIIRVAEGMTKIENSTNSLDFQIKRIEARQWNITINSSDVPMFETDNRGSCIRANKSLLELAGISLDEIMGNGWVNIIFLGDRKLVQDEWEAAVEDKRSFDLKYKIQNNTTNRVFSIRCIAQPVWVEKELVGYVGRYLNIQEMIQDQKTNFWINKTT